LDEPCGNCDNCGSGKSLLTVPEEPFPLKARVHHDEWGDGIVLAVRSSRITVLFENVGEKTLSLDHVLSRGNLRRTV
jgi:ATP-dependent DNA helicase RecQ